MLRDKLHHYDDLGIRADRSTLTGLANDILSLRGDPSDHSRPSEPEQVGQQWASRFQTRYEKEYMEKTEATMREPESYYT